MRIISSIWNVVRQPSYLVITLLATILVFTASTIFLPNFSLVQQVVLSTTLSLGEKLNILTSLYASIGTNYTIFSAGVIVLLSFLVGINTALFVHTVKRRLNAVTGTSSATSIGGIIGGLLGVGCAACGSLAITTILPGTLGSIFLLLPFGGEEMGVLGIGLVVMSIFYLGREISTPAGTCSIPTSITN